MARLLDTNIWIDLTRRRSSAGLKKFILPHVLHPEACVAEPIIFEVLRSAADEESVLLARYFNSLPVLATPSDVWTTALELGRACRRSGYTAGGIDLLIAAVAVRHQAELVTFDADFQKIADESALKLHLLKRPGG